jgi:hypothetical protein
VEKWRCPTNAARIFTCAHRIGGIVQDFGKRCWVKDEVTRRFARNYVPLKLHNPADLFGGCLGFSPHSTSPQSVKQNPARLVRRFVRLLATFFPQSKLQETTRNIFYPSSFTNKKRPFLTLARNEPRNRPIPSHIKLPQSKTSHPKTIENAVMP